jgi:ABC-type cobalamin/Fe3+-siderophores transport system ATPase subunit
LISVTNLSLSDSSGRLLVSNATASLPGSRLSVIGGGNGVGKSLLLASMAGRIRLQAGRISGSILIEHCGLAATTDRARVELADYLPQGERKCPDEDAGWSQGRMEILRHLVNQGKSVLFLDDPTCGFETRRHAEWMRVLWEMTRSGRTVVMTTSDMTRCLPWADWALIIEDGRFHVGPAAEFARESRWLYAESGAITRVPPEHSARLKNIVCAHLKLDEATRVRIEQTCMRDYPEHSPITMVLVPGEPGGTWLFTCGVEELSPHVLSVELAAYPKGHTYVPTH